MFLNEIVLFYGCKLDGPMEKPNYNLQTKPSTKSPND